MNGIANSISYFVTMGRHIAMLLFSYKFIHHKKEFLKNVNQ